MLGRRNIAGGEGRDQQAPGITDDGHIACAAAGKRHGLAFHSRRFQTQQDVAAGLERGRQGSALLGAVEKRRRLALGLGVGVIP